MKNSSNKETGIMKHPLIIQNKKKVIRHAKKRLEISDSQVKGNLKCHILRLLRLKSMTKQEVVNKLSNMYIGYWNVNEGLVNRDLDYLTNEGLIKYSDRYQITQKGLDVLSKKEKSLKHYYIEYLSKEACAKYSLYANVGLSVLEFIVGLLSGSIGLIADAVHTTIDISASAITWIGIKINRETQAALLGGIVLCGIGAFIAFESVIKMFKPVEIHLQVLGLITIVINIAVNALFSYYKFYVGGRTKSISLIADAYHTKTDIWSSVAVLIGLLGASVGFLALDAIAGVVVSFFILLGGYELIKESQEIMQGRDPKIEKFSKFLESHLRILPERGAFVSLWFLNLKEMTKQENLKHVKKGFGKHFPVKLEDKDYESIYTKLEQDCLIESIQGILRLTEKGRKELKILAEKQVSYITWFKRKFINARKIDWFAEGLCTIIHCFQILEIHINF